MSSAAAWPDVIKTFERLDPAVIDQLMVRMREKLGVTGVVITHDLRSAYTVGTRIAMLYEGRVRWQGTIDEIHSTTDPVVRQFIADHEVAFFQQAADGSAFTKLGAHDRPKEHGRDRAHRRRQRDLERRHELVVPAARLRPMPRPGALDSCCLAHQLCAKMSVSGQPRRSRRARASRPRSLGVRQSAG